MRTPGAKEPREGGGGGGGGVPSLFVPGDMAVAGRAGASLGEEGCFVPGQRWQPGKEKCSRLNYTRCQQSRYLVTE